MENKFMVGRAGEDVVILAFARKLSREDALNLAANIVAICDWSEGHADFEKALEEVKKT